ncbi:hypothetical protein GALL_253540 [mine drainage metagenome]|uniref:Uncharacterized protein n=1 Tax=mine drainage metagenome TaxID=410659 RepID=A0A1J5RT76_9ZZZZ
MDGDLGPIRHRDRWPPPRCMWKVGRIAQLPRWGVVPRHHLLTERVSTGAGARVARRAAAARTLVSHRGRGEVRVRLYGLVRTMHDAVSHLALMTPRAHHPGSRSRPGLGPGGVHAAASVTADAAAGTGDRLPLVQPWQGWLKARLPRSVVHSVAVTGLPAVVHTWVRAVMGSVFHSRTIPLAPPASSLGPSGDQASE